MTDTIALTREEIEEMREGISWCDLFLEYQSRHCKVEGQSEHWRFCPLCKRLTEFAKEDKDE